MRSINLKNKGVIELLEGWNDFCFSNDRSMMQDPKNLNSYKAPFLHTISEEFLREEIAKGDHQGFPTSMKGAELQEFWGSQFYDKKWINAVNAIINDLTVELTAKRNALCAYYPPTGYIGWHNNWNASGYNILLTYSKDGNGWFKYLDPKTNEIVTIDDKPGWSCKVGYYGKQEEPDRVCWHAAYTDEERLTFAYVIPNEFMWESMIDDLQDPDI